MAHRPRAGLISHLSCYLSYQVVRSAVLCIELLSPKGPLFPFACIRLFDVRKSRRYQRFHHASQVSKRDCLYPGSATLEQFQTVEDR